MRGREPSETRFWRGVEIRGFNQIKKFLRQVTPQNKPYYFSEKIFGVRCTFTDGLYEQCSQHANICTTRKDADNLEFKKESLDDLQDNEMFDQQSDTLDNFAMKTDITWIEMQQEIILANQLYFWSA